MRAPERNASNTYIPIPPGNRRIQTPTSLHKVVRGPLAGEQRTLDTGMGKEVPGQPHTIGHRVARGPHRPIVPGDGLNQTHVPAGDLVEVRLGRTEGPGDCRLRQFDGLRLVPGWGLVVVEVDADGLFARWN
jgi:hypothetical protein